MTLTLFPVTLFRLPVRSCPSLSRPEHGHLNCSDGGASYRAECTVRCEQGYRLEGETQLTCLADSQWSGPQPRCVGKPAGRTPLLSTP